jgi:hypothetical protein
MARNLEAHHKTEMDRMYYKSLDWTRKYIEKEIHGKELVGSPSEDRNGHIEALFTSQHFSGWNWAMVVRTWSVS